MKTLIIGIDSYQKIKARTLAIAKGELKNMKGTPKVWFSSLESLAQVLSTKNKALLEVISKKTPKSLNELAILSGRKKSNLSRTLKTLQQYGLVELQKLPNRKELIPIIPYKKLKVNFELFSSQKH